MAVELSVKLLYRSPHAQSGDLEIIDENAKKEGKIPKLFIETQNGLKTYPKQKFKPDFVFFHDF